MFRTKGLPDLPQGQVWIKRIAGLPGERVRMANGALYVNGVVVSLRNTQGEIAYATLPWLRNNGSMAGLEDSEGVPVPEGQYFVLGDNSANSFDSRSWGFLPTEQIVGRGCFRYYPLHRLGFIR